MNTEKQVQGLPARDFWEPRVLSRRESTHGPPTAAISAPEPERDRSPVAARAPARKRSVYPRALAGAELLRAGTARAPTERQRPS